MIRLPARDEMLPRFKAWLVSLRQNPLTVVKLLFIGFASLLIPFISFLIWGFLDWRFDAFESDPALTVGLVLLLLSPLAGCFVAYRLNKRKRHPIIFLPLLLYLVVVILFGFKARQEVTEAPKRPPEPYFTFGPDRWEEMKLIPLNLYKEPTIEIAWERIKPEISLNLYYATKEDLLEFLTYKYKEGEERERWNRESSYAIDTNNLNSLASWQVDTNEENKTISLPIEKVGVYYLEGKATGGGAEAKELSAKAFLLANKKGLIARGDNNKTILWTADLKTSKSEPGVKLLSYNLEEKPTVLGETITNDSGLAELKPNEKLDLILGLMGEEVIVAPFNVPNSLVSWWQETREKPDYKVFAFTDRPIYRPGDTVYFKGIVRLDDDASYLTPSGKLIEIKVSIPWSEREPLYERIMLLENNGTFDGSFKIDEETKASIYFLDVTIDEHEFSGTSLMVASYRKPEFELSLDTDRFEYISKDKIKLKISGKYFFGKPVISQEVEYSVRAIDFYERRGLDLEGLQTELNYTGQYFYGDKEITKGVVKLDQVGTASVDIATDINELEGSKIFIIEAQTTDQTQFSTLAVKRVLVHQGLYNIFPAPEKRYTYKFGQEVSFGIQTFDLENNPLPVAKISGEIVKIGWKKTGAGKYPQWEEEKENMGKFETSTNEEGKGIVKFNPPTAGRYQIILKSKDGRDNQIIAKIGLFVTDKELPVYSFRESQIQVKSDKEEYSLGDSAKVDTIFSAPVSDVLFALERGKIYEYKVLSVNGTQISEEIEINEKTSPNIFATFTTFVNGDYSSGNADLKVPALHKKIKVKIKSDKSLYKPGEEATVTIQTTNILGEPVAANVSLAVVDKSIFSLREASQDIYRTFYSDRWLSTEWTHSLVGIGYYLADGGGGGGGPAREIFVDTAYWNPNIFTDDSGKAQVRFKLPDNLTTWVATSYAANNFTQVGQGTTEFTVNKDLVVRPILSRFLTNEDKTEIQAIILNFTGQDDAFEIKLEIEGANIGTSATKEVSVKNNEFAQVNWPIEVDPSATQAKIEITAKAKSSGKTDGIIQNLPIKPFGYESIFTQAGEGSGQIDINLSKEANSDHTTLTLYLSPTLGATIPKTLEYLAGYPYGCIEQTISRFLPTLIVAKEYQFLGIEKPKLIDNLSKMVEKGLKGSENLQSYDGGWGWWPEEKSDITMTGYTVFALKMAKDQGFDVSEKMFERGIEFLKENTDQDTNEELYRIYVLSTLGVDETDKIETLKDKNNSGLAYAVLALNNAGKKDQAKSLLEELKSKAKFVTDGLAYWEEAPKANLTSSHNATALALRALLAVEPTSDLSQKAARWLAQTQTGNYWTNTYSSVNVILSLIDYVKTTQEFSADYTYRVALGGKELTTGTVDSSNIRQIIEPINISVSEIKQGKNQLKIEKQGSGRLYFSFFQNELISQKRSASQENGLKITRRYKDLDGSEKTSFKVNDLVKVELIVESPTLDNAYFIIQDNLPSGFETVDTSLGTTSDEIYALERKGIFEDRFKYTEKDIRDDQVALFTRQLGSGENKFMYLARATTPGEFTVNPARIFLMYTPSVWGNSEGAIIKVEQ